MSQFGTIEDREKVAAVWKPLATEGWSQLANADWPTWKKGNELISAFIEQIEPDKLLFSVDIPDAGTELCQQVMESTTVEGAMVEGNHLLFEFLVVGIEEMGGFKFQLNRPHNEVRFKSMIAHGGTLHGLDDNGVLWKHEPIGNKWLWTKVSMERYEPRI